MSIDVGPRRMTTLLTFDTTHHALWAEQIVADHRLGAQVVPSPAEANAKCDLAIECLDEDLSELCRALEAAGVPFRIFVRNRGEAGEA